MKIILLVILFFINTVCYSNAIKLKYERINVHFNGVVNSDITVVCYGTGSIILSSTDNGNNWSQKCIHDDSLDISQMVYGNDNYYALLTRDYYVIGGREAKYWKSIYTGILGQQSIEVYEDFVFILGMQELFVFKNNQLQEKIKLIDTNKYSELKIFWNQLIVAGEKGKLIAIDLNNFEQTLIDFGSLGVCQNCQTLRRMRIDGNNLYLSHGIVVLKTEDLKVWNVAAGNTSLYDVNDGMVYDLRALNTKKLMAAKLAFYKSYPDSNKIISLNWEQRNVDILAFIDYKFINDSVVIAVGKDKLIANSMDGGINWELKSNFKSLGFMVLNDSIYFSINDKGRIYKTLNAGVTWLPPLYTDTTMTWFKVPRYSEFNENGYGFLVASDDDNRNNLMVTYDYGNSYTLSKNGLSGYFSPDDPSFLKTEAGYNIIFPRGLSKVPLTTLVKIDTALKYVSWKNIYDSLLIVSIKKINENEYLGMAKDKHWPYYVDGDEKLFNYWFLKSTDNGESWEKQFEIFMGDTSFKPTINKFGTKLLLGGIHWYKEVKDTPNINQLFIIDMESGGRERLFNDIVASYGTITEYKDYLLFGGNECLFVNSNYRTDLKRWEKHQVPGKNIRSIKNQSDKFFLTIYNINTRQTNSYYSTIDFESGVETQTEIKTYLYSFPPYPNPANNLVMSDIYWDTRFDFDNADIGIYNYTGARIADRDAIVIDKMNNYSGKLFWDCTGYESGVYFIIIKHGDARRVIPVVVGE